MSTAANPKASQTHSSDAPRESTGAVTSDSLAAESIKADGGFAENEHAAISSVKGSNSTLNTTDTSGASVLQPAADGSARAKQESKGLGSDEKGVSGVKYPDAAGNVQFDGIHSTEGYVGGPSGSGSGAGGGSGSGSTDIKSAFGGASGDSFADGAGPTSSGESGGPVKGVTSGSEAAKKATISASSSSGASGSSAQIPEPTKGTSGSAAADAPNYAATVSGALRPEGEDKPKGKNLIEGGIPETKTFTGDVGGQHDPGRVAEQEFQKVTAGNAASAAEKHHEGGAGQLTGGKFDVLESERA